MHSTLLIDIDGHCFNLHPELFHAEIAGLTNLIILEVFDEEATLIEVVRVYLVVGQLDRNGWLLEYYDP